MARVCCRHDAAAPKLSPVVGIVEGQISSHLDLERANQLTENSPPSSTVLVPSWRMSTTSMPPPSSPVLKNAVVEDVNDKHASTNDATATEVEGDEFVDQHQSL